MIYSIICEFNPFHSGHKHLIDSIKSNDDGVICVMSGNFVQRGEFAVYDKFTRAKASLENGADLVIELPCAYSLKSANGFAKAGAGLIEALKVADRIAFGAECDDINQLTAVADKIKNNEQSIRLEMKKGLSYPAARRRVIDSSILDTPNNILALEYIMAANLPCVAVKRIGDGHDSNDSLYSASAIRKTLSDNEICSMKNCESAVLSKLRTMNADDFSKIEDVGEGLENRIVDAVRSSVCLNEIYDKIKTKRYTHSRIRRIILNAYLGIENKYSQAVPYIRILGFNDKGRDILSEIKKRSQLPVISRYGDTQELDAYGRELFELECRCTDLYNLGYKNPLPCGTEQRSKIIII